VLGDKHLVFLDALSTVLTQEGHSVGAVARSVTEMVSCVRQQQPDVCLINRNLTVDDCAETVGRVVDTSPDTRVVVLSAHADTDSVMRALDAGASGYLHKSRRVSALLSAIDRVLDGHVVVDVPQTAPVRRSGPENDAHRLAGHLTGRERECLAMLVEGLDTAAMIARFGVSRPTVRTHVQAVLNKLGVHSRLEAASFAVRTGVLDSWREENLSGRRAV
jgi:DNA-binding NarL/FixJ family response regulator